jgi:hypothetical protein
MMISRSIPVKVRNVSDTILGKSKHIIRTITFPPDIVLFVRYADKYGTAKQGRDNKIRCRKDAIYMPGNSSKDTSIIFRTYYFSITQCVPYTNAPKLALNVHD